MRGIDGAKGGLTGKMSRKYKVVERTDQDKMHEHDSLGYDEYEQAGADEERYHGDNKLEEPLATTYAITRSDT